MENPSPHDRKHGETRIGLESGSGSGPGSGSSMRTSSSGEDKKFACPSPGCEKRFTRAEHLHRHALNHTNGDHACPRCSAAFKRRDLLDRHMNRHRQKDLEAGGEGCGILDTRKRAWKAPDGSVAERRPHPLERAPARGRRGTNRPRTQTTANHENLHLAPQAQDKPHEAPLQLPTSPISERETDDAIFHVPDCGSRIDSLDPSIGHVQHQQNETGVPQFDFFINSLVPSAYNTEDPLHLWNEQPFQPDTASSFNMPYTTAGDYNWLFNVQRSVATDQAQPCPVIERADVQQPVPYGNAMTPRSSSTNTRTNIHDRQRLHGEHDREQFRFGSPSLDFHRQQPVSPKSVGNINNMAMPGIDINNMNVQSGPGQFAGHLATRHAGNHYIPSPHKMERPLSRLDNAARLPIIDGATHKRLLDVIANAKPCLPDNTTLPLQEHPLLSLTAMQSYADSFFTRFNVAYPIIHTASFRPDTAEPLLLLSVILLGATYAAKDAHQVAVCIHDVIRPSVFAHDGFSARPALWTLQTILLVECFGKSRAGQKQHDMSHLFHGLLINLIRRSDCQSVRPAGPPSANRSQTTEQHACVVEEAWKRWAEAEQKKRLALYCFMWDTQHAVLFCQSLCMSAFELRLNFPCNQHVWEAEHASAWEQAWWATTPPMPPMAMRGEAGPKALTQPFYLPTLRAYLTPSGPPAPAELNLHGRVLVLHGLMSVFWDMQRRDQTSLGASVGSVPGASSWRQMIAAAYDHWKRDFDACCSGQLAQLQQQEPQQWPELASEISAYASSANAVYHAAQCLLRMEFLDIQIYAGARSILGRPVQQRDYLRSAQIVKSWASAAATADVDLVGDDEDGTPVTDRSCTPRTPSTSGSTVMVAANAVGTSDAAGAVWHAARMLRDVVPDADADAMASLFHVPWCLYMATLTCWAFYHASPRSSRDSDADADVDVDDGLHGGEMDADEMVWDSRAEMTTLIAGMTASPEAALRLGQRHRKRLTRRRTNALVWVMADTLTKVRWGIVHAGVMVLRGLVPARLINQYETEE